MAAGGIAGLVLAAWLEDESRKDSFDYDDDGDYGCSRRKVVPFLKKYGQPLQQEISSPITSVFMPLEKIWRFMEQSRKAALYKHYSPQETIQRARSKLGKGAYLSSEHFAMWCKTGISE